VTWPSLDDYEQQIFLQDALEQPALPLVVDRITSHELEALARLIEEIRRAHARGDAATYHRLVRRMHGELFAAARYPRLLDLIGLVMRSIHRYHPIFVRPFEQNWNRELEIITQRFARVQVGDPAGAAAAVQRGHVAMLDFARRRAAARDPAVVRYLSPIPFRSVPPGA
jgi:DNA-binding GntR family transcriptional regulator